MKTKAAILYEINKPLAIEEIEIPPLTEGQVLVKIAYSGICHSQLNEMRGKKGEDKFLPHTLGHEGSGIVEEIGSGVEKVNPGDRVVLTWIKGYGKDVPATRYKKKYGLIVNSGAISTFLTKAVISENRLVKIPEEMPLLEAALLGCAVPTGAGIVMNTIKIKPKDTIAIFGIGGIGSSALLMVKLSSADVIIAIDINAEKLKNAISLGATHTIDASKQNVLSEIMSITNNSGVDFAIEASGRKEAMEVAFKSVRDKGGLCVLAGNLSKDEKIFIDPFDLIKGKKITGSWGGQTEPDRDIPIYIDLFLARKLNLKQLITHRFNLEDINDAFDLLEKGKLGRGIIEFENG